MMNARLIAALGGFTLFVVASIGSGQAGMAQHFTQVTAFGIAGSHERRNIPGCALLCEFTRRGASKG